MTIRIDAIVVAEDVKDALTVAIKLIPSGSCRQAIPFGFNELQKLPGL